MSNRQPYEGTALFTPALQHLLEVAEGVAHDSGATAVDVSHRDRVRPASNRRGHLMGIMTILTAALPIAADGWWIARGV
ncbi:hypothetical protein ACWF82_07100 [Nocardia sp. NPDC055053]